jgi:hypothetical protein
MNRRRVALMFLVVLLGLTIVSSAWTAERHPQIRAAQRDLSSAKYHLERAARDFGGHRAKAVALISKAQEELRLALDFDRTH